MKAKKIGSHLYLALVAALIAASRFSASATVTGNELEIGISQTLTPNVYSGIAGGGGNIVRPPQSLIGCGSNNFIGTNSPLSFIGGGEENYIDTNSSHAVIVGGGTNYIGPNSPDNFVGGGFYNESYDTASFIGAGEGNVVLGEASVICGGQTNWNSGYYSAVVGGAYNFIPVGGNGNGDFIGAGSFNTNYGGWSSIVGGSLNLINNPDSFGAFIGGGVNNAIVGPGSGGIGAAIVGGYYNTNVGQYSFTGGGRQNYVKAAYGVINGGNSNSIIGASVGATAVGSAIGGGSSNTISFAHGASIGGGLGNFVAAQGATIPGGQYASATNYGQQAYASGAFAAGGDAQTSTYVLRNTTTTSSPTELFLDGSGARMALPDNTSWTFDILVVGRSSTGGNTGSYQILGSIQKTSGTTSIVGSVTVNTLAESVSAWDATAQADNSNGALVVYVIGDNTTVRWVATVRTVEVTN